MGLFERVRGLFAAVQPAPLERVRGRPPSGNGASSFHLWWTVPPGRIQAAAVTVEVRVPPAVADLYFFALQATFDDGLVDAGGAHLGLQWNRHHPGGRAVNWGGYDSTGSVLRGSPSPLPSRPDDPNTRDYPWSPGRRYRLEIGPAQPAIGGFEWPGAVTDLSTDERVVVRSLPATSRELRRPVVWSEVFADCGAPGVEVRWSDLTVVTDAGRFAVESATVAYQGYEMGGCSNTNSSAEAGQFVQRTQTARTTPPGWRLEL